MVNILKISKYAVKFIAVLISLAFIINSVAGFMGSLELMDGEKINLDDIQPGDFAINFSNLSVNIGVNIENTGIYDLEGIELSLLFEVRSNLTGWEILLNTSSTQLDSSFPETGQLIKSGESAVIELNAEVGDFSLNLSEIATIFGLPTNWDLGDLLDTNFETRMQLDFSIAYAFKQYQLDFRFNLENDAIKEGF